MNFNTMLDDVYKQLDSHITQTDTLILPKPEIEKSTTRCIWTNIDDFLKITRTEKDHLFDFIRNEIEQKIQIDWYSFTNNFGKKKEGLIIHDGKTNITNMTKKISHIMIKYINQYIICKICNKSHTEMIRDIKNITWKIKCSDCNSEYCL